MLEGQHDDGSHLNRKPELVVSRFQVDYARARRGNPNHPEISHVTSATSRSIATELNIHLPEQSVNQSKDIQRYLSPVALR